MNSVSDSELQPLTIEEWKRAFHRAVICADWSTLQIPCASTGPNGESWVPDAIDIYDVEANARLILDNEVMEEWNRDCGYKWAIGQVLRV